MADPADGSEARHAASRGLSDAALSGALEMVPGLALRMRDETTDQGDPIPPAAIVVE